MTVPSAGWREVYEWCEVSGAGVRHDHADGLDPEREIDTAVAGTEPADRNLETPRHV